MTTPKTEEMKAIAALKRLSKIWPKTLYLFSAGGRLHVMQCDEDGLCAEGNRGGHDEDSILATIDIPNDGGDW